MIHFPCGLLAFKALPPLVPSSDHSFGSVSYIYAFNAACLPACFLCTRETCFIVSSSATPLRTSSNPFHPSSVDPFPPPLLVRSSCCTFHSISTEPPLLYHKIIVVSSSASSHLGANDEAKSLLNRLLFEVSSCGGAFPEWDFKTPHQRTSKTHLIFFHLSHSSRHPRASLYLVILLPCPAWIFQRRTKR